MKLRVYELWNFQDGAKNEIQTNSMLLKQSERFGSSLNVIQIFLHRS